MKHLIAIILLSIPCIAWSQKNDFRTVDNYVYSLQADKDITIPDLTNKLTTPFSSDLLKVRAIFVWIAANIEYDSKESVAVSATVNPSDKEIYNDTYKFRKGNCRGYSQLFKYMLDLSGIKSRVISGYIRTDLKNYFLQNPNHAWNSVNIENKWYLFDVTWARDPIKRINDLWFKTDPEIFILNHFPVYQPHTLTQEQYSLDDFRRFPVYTRAYYDLNFSNDLSKTGHVEIVNDTATVKIKPNIDCTLRAKLYDTNGRAWIDNKPGCLVSGADYIKLYIPKKGKFILKLGALKKDGGSYLYYDELIYYTIENK